MSTCRAMDVVRVGGGTFIENSAPALSANASFVYLCNGPSAAVGFSGIASTDDWEHLGLRAGFGGPLALFIYGELSPALHFNRISHKAQPGLLASLSGVVPLVSSFPLLTGVEVGAIDVRSPVRSGILQFYIGGSFSQIDW